MEYNRQPYVGIDTASRIFVYTPLPGKSRRRIGAGRAIGRPARRPARLIGRWGLCTRRQGRRESRRATRRAARPFVRNARRRPVASRGKSVFHASANALVGSESASLVTVERRFVSSKCDRTIRSAVSRSFPTLALKRNLSVSLYCCFCPSLLETEARSRQ